MLNEYLFPLLLILLASLFQGTFGLGMKYVKPLAWEAWWLVHATVAMLIFPLVWALLVVPDLSGVISQSPTEELVAGALLGFLWGIGGIMFGVSVGYLGMSLTYGIVMGLCSLAGALIPLFVRFNEVATASLPFIFAGLVLLAGAVIIVTVAGLKRDKLLAESGKGLQGIKQGKAFRTGLIIASVCGLLSSMLAVGFDRTGSIGGCGCSGTQRGLGPLGRRPGWSLPDECRLRPDPAAQEQVIQLVQDAEHVFCAQVGHHCRTAVVRGTGDLWARCRSDGRHGDRHRLADDAGSVADCQQCGRGRHGRVERDGRPVEDHVIGNLRHYSGHRRDVVCLDDQTGRRCRERPFRRDSAAARVGDEVRLIMNKTW